MHQAWAPFVSASCRRRGGGRTSTPSTDPRRSFLLHSLFHLLEPLLDVHEALLVVVELGPDFKNVLLVRNVGEFLAEDASEPRRVHVVCGEELAMVVEVELVGRMLSALASEPSAGSGLCTAPRAQQPNRVV